VGAAVLMALTVSAVRDAVPKERTGSAMGMFGTMSAIGTASGLSLGGLSIAAFGWPSIFLALVPLGVLAAVLTVRLPDPGRAGPPAERAGGTDLPGVVLLGATVAAYALAMTADGGGATPANGVLLALAALGAGLFVAVERRARHPLVPPAAFRNVGFVAGLAGNALVATVMMATLVVGPFYLAYGLGLGPAGVGLAMAVGPVISVLTGVPAGRATDRFGAPATRLFGLAQMVAGCVALALASSSFSLLGYLAAVVVLTPGYQLFQAANNTAVMIDVDEAQRGAFAGLLNLSRNLGLITGASAMGTVFVVAVGTADMAAATPAEIGVGMAVAFGLAGGLMGVAVGLAAAAGRRQRSLQSRSDS
ncbi:MAG: MFS transporter, partial [Rhodospirillaceae bacterium]